MRPAKAQMSPAFTSLVRSSHVQQSSRVPLSQLSRESLSIWIRSLFSKCHSFVTLAKETATASLHSTSRQCTQTHYLLWGDCPHGS